jgi:hypothetical protein
MSQWMYPGFYSPGQMAFNNNAELSHLITMAAGPLLGAFAGPGNFMPHMMPTQNAMDQFALRAYQNQTLQATRNLSSIQQPDVTNLLLGLRSAITPTAPSALNREQAANMAGIINNPFMKAALGSAVGPENLEAMLYGSRGDATALGNVVNRVGYYRPNPTGGGRMDAAALSGFSAAMFSELYAPHGNVADMVVGARSGAPGGGDRLLAAAGMQNKHMVTDADVAARLRGMDTEKLGDLYNKYVQGGTATTAAAQAQELTKFDRAVAASGVLKDHEATIGQLETRAKQRPVHEMHGLMASQVGQLGETMFQRGLLPQSLGAMSPAERVKAMSAATRDDETMNRLADEYLKADFAKRSDKEAADYKALTTDEQRTEFLRARRGDARTTLEDTFKEIDKTATGATGAKAASELEQLGGFDLLATNVDAKRSASAIKQYTGAVAAVREIFGDNGNPNAPMPALLAVLDQLTQGAMGSMKPAHVETTLRQMQTLAKESGVGLEQLATLSATMGARGQQLGLSPQTTMSNVAGTLAMVQTMQNTGAFSGNVFGTLDKPAAMQRVGELMQRGDASRNALSMAALTRIVDADPKRFGANSELVKAVEAYRNPTGDGTYTFTDASGKQVTRNIRQVIGAGGVGAAEQILASAGGRSDELGTMMLDPRTKEKMQAGFGFLTQKYEAARDINAMTTSSAVAKSLRGAGLTPKAATSRAVGQRVTEMILDSAGMNLDDQVDYMQKQIEAEMVTLYAEKGLGSEADAKAAAKAMNNRSTFNQMIAQAGAVHGMRTGGETLSTFAQSHGRGRDAAGAAEAARSAAVAERRRVAGAGLEGTPLGRISDYLVDIATRGEKFNFNEFLKAMAPVISDKEMLQRYAKEMGGGFDALTQMTRDASITREDIDKASEADLRKYAKFDKDVKIVSRDDMAKRRNKKLQGMSDADIKAAYAQHIGGGDHLSRAQQIAELGAHAGYQHATDIGLLEAKEKSFDQLRAAAMGAVGTAKEGQAGTLEDLGKIHKAYFRGDDKGAVSAGTAAAMRLFDVKGKKAEALTAAVMDASPEGRKNLLKELGMSEAAFTAGEKSLASGQLTRGTPEYRKQFQAHMLVALHHAQTSQLGKARFEQFLDPQLQPGAAAQAPTWGASSAAAAQQAAAPSLAPNSVRGNSPDTAAAPADTKETGGILGFLSKLADPQAWGGGTAGRVQQAQAASAAIQTAGADTGAKGGGSNEPLQISGRLTLDGLESVMLEATSDRALTTEAGGAPVVKDRPLRPGVRV